MKMRIHETPRVLKFVLPDTDVIANVKNCKLLVLFDIRK